MYIKLVSWIMIRTHPIRFRAPEIQGYCVHVFEEIVIEYRKLVSGIIIRRDPIRFSVPIRF